MNLRTNVLMELIKKDEAGNEKVFVLSVPFGSAYQEAYDAAVEIANNIVQLSKEHQEKLEQAKAEQESPETNQVEEPQGV